jgi:hypothetical protein
MGNFETKFYSIFIPHLLLHFFYYDILTTWKWSSIGDASFIRYSLGLKVWTLQYTEYDFFFMSKQVTNAYKLRKVVWRLAGFNCCEIAWNAIKRSLSILQIAKMTWSQVMSNIQAINMNITINNKNKLWHFDLQNNTIYIKLCLGELLIKRKFYKASWKKHCLNRPLMVVKRKHQLTLIFWRNCEFLELPGHVLEMQVK